MSPEGQTSNQTSEGLKSSSPETLMALSWYSATLQNTSISQTEVLHSADTPVSATYTPVFVAATQGTLLDCLALGASGAYIPEPHGMAL